MKRLNVATVLAMFFMAATSLAPAGDLFSVNFEAGSIGTPGNPVNGWEQRLLTSVGESAVPPEIGSTGRTFLTGTDGNDEALLFSPFTPGQNGGFGDSLAVFRPDTPITVPADSTVYVIMEHFSDLTLPNNKIKIRFAAGQEGDGGNFIGLDGTTQESFRSEISLEVKPSGNSEERSWDVRTRDASGSGGPESFFREAHWKKADVEGGFNAPLNNPLSSSQSDNFLNRSYEATALFRPNTDAGFTDTEGQVRDSFGTVTRQDTPFRRNGDPTDGPQPLVGEATIDYVALAFARFAGAYDGPGGDLPGDPNHENFNSFGEPNGYSGNAQFSNGDPISNPSDYTLSDNALGLKVGIKSVRFGIAGAGDIDLDDDVDTADFTKTVIEFTGDGASTKTWFDGDFDNDTDVDGSDLNTVLINFTPPPAIAAFGSGVAAGATAGMPELSYNSATGEVIVDPAGVEIAGIDLLSNGLFNPNAADFTALNSAVGFDTTFTDSTANLVAWISALAPDEGADPLQGPFSLGPILPAGLTQTAFLNGLIQARWSQAGGGGGHFAVAIPEPSAGWLLAAGVAMAGVRRFRPRTSVERA